VTLPGFLSINQDSKQKSRFPGIEWAVFLWVEIKRMVLRGTVKSHNLFFIRMGNLPEKTSASFHFPSKG